MLYALLGLNIILIVLIVILLMRQPAQADYAKILQEVKDSFKSISFDTLKEQAKLGGQELDNKKQLIDQRLDAIKQELDKIELSLKKFSDDSGSKITGVATRLDTAAQVITELRGSTSRLNEILGSSQKRGEWGQRMAKDILDLAGLKENLNYTQQETTESGRPDFTFKLPNGNKINMDCKFPLANYKAYVEAPQGTDREKQLKLFLSDARGRLKEVAKKDYINPEEGTLDYAIMFISNEQVFNFINENDTAFMDDAIKMKVVVCSPYTLYAFVAVIRQAADNLKMEKTAREILSQLGKFAKQWEEFKSQFDAVGDALEAARKEYEKLTTTRARMLESSIKAVERIRENQDIPPSV